MLLKSKERYRHYFLCLFYVFAHTTIYFGIRVYYKTMKYTGALWENRSSVFLTWSDTNQAVQLQKMVRGLKFRIKVVEGLYYPCSENKGADQLRAFVFAYAKSRFSHDAAHAVLLFGQHIFRNLVCILWLHYSVVKPLCKVFRLIATQIMRKSENLGKLCYYIF